MFCTNCGSIIPEGAKFCTNCGAAAPAAQENTAPAIPENTVEETVPEATEQINELNSAPETPAPQETQISDTAAGAASAGTAVFGSATPEPEPVKPKPQGTWYDQPYAMSQNQVNEGNYNYQQQQQSFQTDPVESVKNPSFGDAIRSFFTRYIDFKGRSSRAEYWYIVLLNILVSIALAILIKVTGSHIFTTIDSLYSLAVFVPSLAIWFRRLHDTGRSGWYTLVLLIPIAGVILSLVWLCSDSEGGNLYGPEPKMK